MIRVGCKENKRHELIVAYHVALQILEANQLLVKWTWLAFHSCGLLGALNMPEVLLGIPSRTITTKIGTSLDTTRYRSSEDSQ